LLWVDSNGNRKERRGGYRGAAEIKRPEGSNTEKEIGLSFFLLQRSRRIAEERSLPFKTVARKSKEGKESDGLCYRTSVNGVGSRCAIILEWGGGSREP